MNRIQNSTAPTTASTSALLNNPKSDLPLAMLDSMEITRTRWIATELRKPNPDSKRIQEWTIEILDITRRRLDISEASLPSEASQRTKNILNNTARKKVS